jgi:hypothetical protein
MNTRKQKLTYQFILMFAALTALQSCGVLLSPGRRSTQSQNSTVQINTAQQIQALTPSEYEVLRQTNGSASSKRFYILFIPIGKHKTTEELYENSYYNAVENLPSADALLLPRQSISRFTLPLILFTYDKRTVSTTGVGISLKGKSVNNQEKSVAFTQMNVEGNCNMRVKSDSKFIITNANEMNRLFSIDKKDAISKIDFTNQFVVAIVGKAKNKLINHSVSAVQLIGNQLKMFYEEIELGDAAAKEQAITFVVLDKKMLANVSLKKTN